ncbi:MAG: BamA/TamA family outer membrane protein, partial [Candidatus Firestonebacteria bacterium]|nr:BamA/TamA family outer membrane protein [Candidatus Firestonebacteria bacterium]
MMTLTQGRKLSFNSNKCGCLGMGLILLTLVVGWGPGRAEASSAPPRGDFPLAFEGRQALSEASLREAASMEIDRFYEQGHRPADAEDAAVQMEQKYRRAGFAFARVHYRLGSVLGGPGLIFAISEGSQVLLETVALAGNSVYAQAVLLPFFQGKHLGFLGLGPVAFNQTEIETGTGALRDFYLGEGYLDIQCDPPQYVFSPDRRRVQVKQNLHEGRRYLIREVNYSGDVLVKLLPALEAVQREFVGKPYYRRRNLNLEERILQSYGDEGYADAVVSVEAKIRRDLGQVSLQARIRSGVPVTLTQVAVSGNTVTQTAFILSRLPSKAGQPLRLSQKNQGFSNLYATGLFSSVDLSLEKIDDPKASVLQVTVDELPYKELYASAGYGSYEWLRFLAGFKEKNIFGTGRIFRTEAGASFKGENALTGLTDPWFFNTEVTGDFSVFYRRRVEPVYVSQEFGSTLQFSRQLWERVFLSWGYTLRSTHLFDLKADADLQGAVRQYQTGAIVLQTYYDTRDNPLYPARGQKTDISSEFSHPDFGSQITYDRYTFGTEWFVPVTEGSVLALRYATGLLVPGDGWETIPLDKRFYNGGANS